jgi:hypothetical protein
MDGLAERLAKQFPELPADEIAHAIRGQYEGFDNSPIRDFILGTGRGARAGRASR